MPTLTFLGALRRAAGRASVVVDAENVGAALTALGPTLGQSAVGLLVREGALQPDVEVLVNGRNIVFLQGLDTPLEAADHVTVFISGLRGFPGG